MSSMASFVLSECGFRSLPRFKSQTRTGLTSRKNNLFKLTPLKLPNNLDLCSSFKGSVVFNKRNWTLKVATSSVSYKTASKEISGVVDESGEFFDTGAPPPFKLADIKAAIPKHCWVKDAWKSISYVVRDVAVIFGLAVVTSCVDSWIVWPVYWFCQGTMFWALYVLGHDCDHGSFSDNQKLNAVMGHVLHSSIMVPYHGWRMSHRVHHQNQGHADNDDQSWHPMSERVYKDLDDVTRAFRFTLPFPTLVFPFYLGSIRSGIKGSNVESNSDVFTPLGTRDLVTSAACLSAMAALLVYLSFEVGPLQMLKLYGIPYWVFVIWVDSVTYLHHHDDHHKLPWYRGKEWNYLRGGLSTVDRDYGWINKIHHDIGTHVIHHLFPQIPHYHLVEATEAAKPVLGKYYREAEKSGPLPFHLIGSSIRSMKQDHYVTDTGDVVYYQTDPELNEAHKVLETQLNSTDQLRKK